MKNPSSVIAPQDKFELIAVIYNSGAGRESIAYRTWEGAPVICCRHNGSKSRSDVGSPQSRGHPTWFVLPWHFGMAALQELLRHHITGDSEWAKGMKTEALFEAIKAFRA